MQPYDVTADTARQLLTITLRGFWDMPTFEAFRAEFEKALRTLHHAGGCEVALVDGSEFAVQSQEVLEGFEQVMRANVPYLAKRTASVVPAALNRLQASRVAETLARRDFHSRADAEAWLFGT